MKEILKQISFSGTSLFDLRAFPESARKSAGYQLDRLQRGLSADDWKPMPSIGSGVREVRIRDSSGAYRVIYVAKLSDAIHVLHCFQKKSQKTSKSDLSIALKRYKELLKESKDG